MGPYVQEAHVAMGNVHQPPEQKLQRIKCMGMYQPSTRKDVYNYVKGFSCEMRANPIVVNAEYPDHMSPTAPAWVETSVEYLTIMVIPKKVSKK